MLGRPLVAVANNQERQPKRRKGCSSLGVLDHQSRTAHIRYPGKRERETERKIPIFSFFPHYSTWALGL